MNFIKYNLAIFKCRNLNETNTIKKHERIPECTTIIPRNLHPK